MAALNMSMYGTAKTCPPWAYGARVWPGPNWEWGAQDVVKGPDGQLARVLGRVLIPDRNTFQEWAVYLFLAAEQGALLNGGFAPDRSVWVEWGPDLFDEGGPEYFYKAHDEGMSDLYYSPAQDINKEDRALAMWRNVRNEWRIMVMTRVGNYMWRQPANEETIRVCLAVQDFMAEADQDFQHQMIAASQDMKNIKVKPGSYDEAFPESGVLAEVEDNGEELPSHKHITNKELKTPSSSSSRLRPLKRKKPGAAEDV